MLDNPIFVLALIIFVFITTIIYIVSRVIYRKHFTIYQRLQRFSLITKQEKKKVKNKSKSSLVKSIAIPLESVVSFKKWEKPLIQAGMTFKPSEFFIYRLLWGAGAILVGALYQLQPFLYIPIGIVGFMIPRFYIKMKFKKRMYRCSVQLSEALGTMSNSMRAGFSFMQAMKLISEEFPDPIGVEFGKAIKDTQYGASIEEALTAMLERMPHKDLDMVVKALIVQRSSGGNLAVLLETIQETIRGRFRVQEELRTLTSQGRLSSWIITLLPVALALYLMVVNPDYFQHLTGTPLGMVMLGVGCMNIVIGWFLIQKVINIEV